MKTRSPALLAGLVTTLCLAGCQAPGTDPGARGGAGGRTGTGGRTDTGGRDAGRGPDGGGGRDVGAGGKACGGPAQLTCRAGEYCEFMDNSLCGSGDATGVCRRRPTKCAQHCEGACGCDGRIYCTECMANAAGVSTDPGLRVCSRIQTCEDVKADIANEVARGGSCAAVVRLDHATREIRSAHVACGPTMAVSPVRARAVAERDTGFGVDAQLVSGLAPVDEYVFWEPPSDRGGVAVVSARNGATVFGGSIVWGGPGEVVYPVAYRHPSAVGPTCSSSAPRPSARGISLETLDELSGPDVDAALDAVWATALPDGVALGASLLDAMVLLYAPQVGMFDPSAAEWVVILNSEVAQ